MDYVTAFVYGAFFASALWAIAITSHLTSVWNSTAGVKKNVGAPIGGCETCHIIMSVRIVVQTSIPVKNATARKSKLT